jgi:hypothetical protein
MYGGVGISPYRINCSETGSVNSTIRLANPRSSRIVASGPPSIWSLIPACTRLPPTITSQVLSLIRRSRRSSTAPPLGIFLPCKRAGMTLVWFRTSTSRGDRKLGRSRNVWCCVMPVCRSNTSRRDESLGRTGLWAISSGGKW